MNATKLRAAFALTDALALAVNCVSSIATDVGGRPIGVVDLTWQTDDGFMVAHVWGTLTRHWSAPVEDLPGNGLIVRSNREDEASRRQPASLRVAWPVDGLERCDAELMAADADALAPWRTE